MIETDDGVPARKGDDPTLEDEMREALRRMAMALVGDDPVELEKRYAEIDAMIDELRKPKAGT